MKLRDDFEIAIKEAQKRLKIFLFIMRIKIRGYSLSTAGLHN